MRFEIFLSPLTLTDEWGTAMGLGRILSLLTLHDAITGTAHVMFLMFNKGGAIWYFFCYSR